jgi:hypothetical protein
MTQRRSFPRFRAKLIFFLPLQMKIRASLFLQSYQVDLDTVSYKATTLSAQQKRITERFSLCMTRVARAQLLKALTRFRY